MNLRDIRQKEFADVWLKTKWGIIYACPRFGKIRTAILALKQLPEDISILIAYPDKKIKQSWKDDFEKWEYLNTNVTYTTHLSLKKHKDDVFDLVIVDEVHLLSEAQISACNTLFKNTDNVLALTGTLSKWTERVLREDLNLRPIVRYSISQAIKEGILPDYEINVITTSLDNVVKQNFNRRMLTEKKKFDQLSYVINQLQEEGRDVKFLRFGRMRIIQKSLGKKKATIHLIQKYEKSRILVFCGSIHIADGIGIPSYNSVNNNKEDFDKFVAGEIKHLAVVKIGNTGVTYTPLNMVVMNYFDSNSENFAQKVNRCMSFEYDNPDKKAKIFIITTNEPVEQKWLKKALEFFDKSKIKYL